jgi:hypothetical protein
MLKFLRALFGSGVVGSIERIASEAIQTDKETAEAKALFIKTLDPNGIMRRELSRFACIAYGFYLIMMTAFNLISAFGFGDPVSATVAANNMVELFMPITTAWGAIITASFGVNATNAIKGK